ncbi:MAG: FemAB family PEP-CTERM system-associated protein [Alphaproteobacteria bacterium]|nr:FemAB family PEP-CTERM system-associated protein [Alphaproteobacteria bacterium]
MVVKLLDNEAIGRWDTFVDGCSDATFFHRAGWKSVIERAFGHNCYFFYAERGTEIVGLLPLVHVKSLLFGNSLISTGFTVGGGPITLDSGALAALEEELLPLAERLKVDHIEYRGGNSQHPDWAQKTNLYANFVREIDVNSEKNMLAIPRKQRAMVRKGINAGLTSIVDDHPDRLHHIYATSVRNLGTPVFSKKLFETLLEIFGSDVDIVTIENDGAAIASVMNFYFRNKVLPYYGGGTFDARPVAGNDFMYWEVMRRAGERGFTQFDFGRSKLGTGAFSFKKNWGFEPMPLTYEYMLRKSDNIPVINPTNPKYRLFIEAWKRLPLPIAKFVGPMISRNLG